MRPKECCVKKRSTSFSRAWEKILLILWLLVRVRHGMISLRWREFIPLGMIGNSPAFQCRDPIAARIEVPKLESIPQIPFVIFDPMFLQ
jgi:hypothetical protein